MKKAIHIVLAFVLVVTVAAVAFFAAGYGWLFKVSQRAIADSFFDIGEGESLTSVALRLERRGFIPSAAALQMYARFTGNDRSIQQGAYIIPQNLSAVEILGYLSSGRQALQRITIPEGKTLRQVAMLFEDAEIAKAGDFLNAAMSEEILTEYGVPHDSMEGYLFPDTYYFATDYPADKSIRHMVDTFFDELSAIYPDYKNLSPAELHDFVTLASIVEREYVAQDEAPFMASVFFNRLDRGMMLESCATVVYVMTEEQGLEHPGRIYFSDLKRESDFNTYINHGLPPGPISGVGRTALDAVFHPAESDYLFFVLESPNASRHVFSENFADHLLASEFYYIKLN